MPGSSDWVNIDVGRLSKDQAVNVAREVRQIIGKLDNVWPNGDRKQCAQMKVTRDGLGNYHFYLNRRALVHLILFCKDYPDQRKTDDLTECPPDVPEFLRWGPRLSSGSTPE